ncbi:calmodulin-like 3 [Perkinsus chesapeaki]|uniref:Calmodulin n=1 Tax=Perkinsus chesapeaki TaxID=330153 RepID=A0A7J6MY35_PERCH|nr:calmodulin-like 3 [Perkinsus chesapeaki]
MARLYVTDTLSQGGAVRRERVMNRLQQTAQTSKYSDCFALLDQDEDGLIGPEELTVALSSIGLRPDADAINDLIREVSQSDVRGDISGIYKDDLEKFLERHLTSSSNPSGSLSHQAAAAELRTGFQLLGASKQVITAADIRAMMARVGTEITEEEAEELVFQHDRSDKGGLTLEEFVAMVTDGGSSMAKML